MWLLIWRRHDRKVAGPRTLLEGARSALPRLPPVPSRVALFEEGDRLEEGDRPF